MNIGLAVREASVGTNATLSGHLTATEEDEADEREALVPAASFDGSSGSRAGTRGSTRWR